MKGDASCHTTNRRFREGYDAIEWGPKCAWIRCQLPIDTQLHYRDAQGRRWHAECLTYYERLTQDKYHWVSPIARITRPVRA